MPVKSWTEEQCAWLGERLPQWHKREKGFVRDVAAAFLEVFPDVERSKLQKVSLDLAFLLHPVAY